MLSYGERYGVWRLRRLYKFSHCAYTFTQKETWFLRDNKEFSNRKLEDGFCPDCKQNIVAIVETRIADGKVFADVIKQKKKVLAAKKRCKRERIFTDKTIPKGKLFGLAYGKNTERHNKYGEVTSVSQRACDWQGSTVLVRTIKVK